MTCVSWEAPVAETIRDDAGDPLEQHCSRCDCMTGPAHHNGCQHSADYPVGSTCPGGWSGTGVWERRGRGILVFETPAQKQLRKLRGLSKRRPHSFIAAILDPDNPLGEARGARALDELLESIENPYLIGQTITGWNHPVETGRLKDMRYIPAQNIPIRTGEGARIRKAFTEGEETDDDSE